MPKKRNYSASRAQNLKVAREEKTRKRRRSTEPNSEENEETTTDDEIVYYCFPLILLNIPNLNFEC
jgi:hypothetical protein